MHDKYSLLPLPIAPADVVSEVIIPSFSLLPLKMHSAKAVVLQAAIGGQESGYRVRDQIDRNGADVTGPALGLWQFEKNGGVKGVMSFAGTQEIAKYVCETRGVDFDFRKVWLALETDDILASAFARLLLWTDTAPLPLIGDAESAWRYYLRTWRPGKPHHSRWQDNYNAAITAVVST